MCERLGLVFDRTPDPEDLSRVWCLAFRPNPDVLSIASSVAERAQIGLFTNNPPAVESGLEAYLPEIARTFERRFFSSRINARKPSPEAFAAVEAASGLRGSALALVDDSRANVDAAQERGWVGIRFEDAAELREELEGRGWSAARVDRGEHDL